MNDDVGKKGERASDTWQEEGRNLNEPYSKGKVRKLRSAPTSPTSTCDAFEELDASLTFDSSPKVKARNPA